MKKRKIDRVRIMVYFIAFIMISSVFGIIFSGYGQQTVSLKYKGIKFVRENDQWSTNINGKKAFFDYHPEEVEHINISSGIIDLLKNKPEIDVTSDVNNTFKDTIALVEYSMSEFLDNNLNVYLRVGFISDNEFDAPIIGCRDATAAIPIIYFKESENTLVNLTGSCIIAEARDDSNFVRIKDRILYGILGIMQ